VQANTGLWILNMGEERRNTEVDHVTVDVPALSIVAPQGP